MAKELKIFKEEIKQPFNDKKYRLSFEGAFDMGILGVYHNGNVSLCEDMLEFIEDKESYEYFKNNFDALYEPRYLNMDYIFLSEGGEEEKLKLLTEFYQKKQEDILKNASVLENEFWKNLLSDMENRLFPFWGEDASGSFEGFIKADLMPKGTFADNEKYAEHVYGEYVKAKKALPENTAPVEIAEKCLPMIDRQKLRETFHSEYLNVMGDSLSFELSSKACDGDLLRGAYSEILSDYSFCDWHNLQSA